jgi:flagellar protein FlgJ
MNSIASNQFQMAQSLLEKSFGSAKTLKNNETNSEDDLRAVAEEFESLFMNMMLKSMRSANRVFSEGNYFDSFESKMYEDMMDEKLSSHLSGSGSLGIADMLVQQLRGGRPAPTYNLPIGEVSRKEAFSSPDSFVKSILPEVTNAAKNLGVNPRHIVAQAALETGWGSHVMFDAKGNNSHNLFGIKAKSDWSGNTVSIESVEVVDGVAVKERSQFKSFDSYQSAIDDYTQMLQSQSRYDKVIGSGDDVKAFGEGLLSGGYATDPEYANKLTRVLQNSALSSKENILAGVHLARGGE